MDPIDQALTDLYHKADAPDGFDTAWRAAIRREEISHMNRNSFWKNIRRAAVPVMATLVLVCGALWAGSLDLAADLAPSTPQVMQSRSAKMEGNAAASYETYDTAADYGMMTASTSGSGMTVGPVETENRKIVRTADLSLSTPDFDRVVEDAQALLTSVGGYVENLNQYGETSRRMYLSLRVPSDRLDEFLQSAQGLGRVVSRGESTTDMTTEYVDNEARLNTLYAKRDRLNELMLKAEDIADLIEIESAIADTQYQIDRYETSQRNIDRQVDMSQVSLNISEEMPGDTALADLPLGERISAGLKATLEWLVTFLRDLLVFVIMALPVAAVFGGIAGIIILIRRLIRRKKGS